MDDACEDIIDAFLSGEDATEIDLDAAVEAQLQRKAEFAREVDREVFRIRVREAARDKTAAEKAEHVHIPALATLDAFLAIPDDSVTHRIERVLPTGGRAVMAAKPKAGKTTFVGNLIRSLVDGEPFLDAFTVTRADRVVLIDDELDERMLRRWLRAQEIANETSVTVVSLKGRLSSFNILDPATRSRWAAHLGAADVVIVDCLRPALDALALSEDKDAGRFLEALDELTVEAGISETVLVHHMGHSGERSRGDSRIQDWPDVLWKLVKDADDEQGDGTPRRVYFTAYGRDVDQPETLLAFEPSSRRLSVAGGSRRDYKVDEASEAVLAAMADCAEPLSGRAIEERLRDTGQGRDTIRAALRRAVADADVLVTAGARNAKLHTLNPSSARVRGSARSVRGRTESECASAPIRAHARSLAPGELAEEEEPAHSAPTTVLCPVCGNPINAVLAAAGETTHVACAETS